MCYKRESCFQIHASICTKSNWVRLDRLRVRGGFLTRKVDLKVEVVLAEAYSCIVPHNYCEIKSNCMPWWWRAQILRYLADEESLPNVPVRVYSCKPSEGKYVHTALTTYIQENVPDKNINLTLLVSTLYCSSPSSVSMKFCTRKKYKFKTNNSTSNSTKQQFFTRMIWNCLLLLLFIPGRLSSYL